MHTHGKVYAWLTRHARAIVLVMIGLLLGLMLTHREILLEGSAPGLKLMLHARP